MVSEKKIFCRMYTYGVYVCKGFIAVGVGNLAKALEGKVGRLLLFWIATVRKAFKTKIIIMGKE